MKCQECEKQGLRSTVEQGVSRTTCAGINQYYDENGHHHHHDPNRRTTIYTCSNGHRWEEETRSKCWCGYPENPGTVKEPPFDDTESIAELVKEMFVTSRVLREEKISGIVEEYLSGPNGEPDLAEAHDYLMRIKDILDDK
jgi:hypothetical protein